MKRRRAGPIIDQMLIANMLGSVAHCETLYKRIMKMREWHDGHTLAHAGSIIDAPAAHKERKRDAAELSYLLIRRDKNIAAFNGVRKRDIPGSGFVASQYART